jgi:hypothetical protein
MIMLVDEDEDEFYVQYMPGRHSCRFDGFKGFAMKHKPEDGDCLVFRLIHQRKLKVRSYLALCSVLKLNNGGPPASCSLAAFTTVGYKPIATMSLAYHNLQKFSIPNNLIMNGHIRCIGRKSMED